MKNYGHKVTILAGIADYNAFETVNNTLQNISEGGLI